MTRSVAIANAHPRLRFAKRAVEAAIAVLDGRFELLPSDLPHLSLSRARLSVLKSKIKNRKSKIPSGCPPGELSLVFLSDPALARIHADFMDDPTATDVITFEGNPAAGLAGEICVSADTAARYVGASPRDNLGAPFGSARGLSLSNGLSRSKRLDGRPRPARRLTPALQRKFSAELTLYMVHGWLHLAGYDDLRPAKKRRMRAAEKRAMALLQAANAVPVFRM